MLAPVMILALSHLTLPASLGTLSSDDHTDDPLAGFHLSPPERSPFERRFSLEARVGIGTPTGGPGVAAEFSFIPELGVGCGVGNNVYGTEYAFWLRGRPLIGRHRAFTVSTGLSTAPFDQNAASAGGVFGFFTGALAQGAEDPAPPDRHWQHAYWLNTDLGYESRNDAFLFRAFGGVAMLLNPSDGTVQPSSDPNAPAADPALNLLLYAGIGVGFTE